MTSNFFPQDLGQPRGAVPPGAGALRMGRSPQSAQPAWAGPSGSNKQRATPPMASDGTAPNYMTQALSSGAGGAQPTTPGVDPAWSRVFGTATPGGLLAQRTATGGATPPLAPPAAPPAPAASQPTPQSAGAVNGATPGAFNGNDENGFSTEQQNGGQSNNEQGGPPATPNYMTDALSAPPATAAPAAAAPPTGAAASTGMGANEMAQPQAPAAGPTGVPKAAAASTVTAGGKQYTLNPGSKLPPAWASLTPAQRQQFLAKHATVAGAPVPGGSAGGGGQVAPPPLAPPGAAAPPAQAAAPPDQSAAAPVSGGQQVAAPPLDTSNAQPGFDPNSATTGQQTLGKYADLAKLKLPTSNPVTGGKLVVGNDSSGLDILQAVGNDPALTRLALEGQSIASKIANGGQGQNAVAADQLARYADIKNVLGQYGVTFSEKSGAGGTGGDTGGTGGGTGDGTGTGSGTTDPNAQVAQGGDTLQQLVSYFNGKGWGDKSVAMAEAEIARQQQSRQETNQQTAATGFAGAADAFKNSGLYKGAQTAAQHIIDNPNTVDEGALENKYVSDQDKLSEQIVQNLSAGAGRRGLSTGAVQGLQTQQLGAAANATASGLGDMKIAQGERERQDQMQAIQTSLATLGGTTGQDISNAATLGNIVGGQPADYQNYSAGAAAAFQNIDAAAAAADAAKKAGQFSYADAAKIAGTVVGAALLA